MSLHTTPVSRCLEKKMRIMGFEIPDLLALFLFLSVLHFIFGRSESQFILVWLPFLCAAAAIRAAKVGKPENFFFHWLKHHFTPKRLSAWVTPDRLLLRTTSDSRSYPLELLEQSLSREGRVA